MKFFTLATLFTVALAAPKLQDRTWPTTTSKWGGDKPTTTSKWGGDKPTTTSKWGGDKPTTTSKWGGDKPTTTSKWGGGKPTTTSHWGGGNPPTTTKNGGNPPTTTKNGGGGHPTTTSYPGGGGDYQPCPDGLFSNAVCCATDVLGLACLNGAPPNQVPRNAKDFQAICAKGGQQPRCCVLPVAGQELLCAKVVGL